NNSVSYQVFAMAELREFPDKIKNGEEFVIMSIPKTSINYKLSDKIFVAADDFIASHNGNYYISLYGFDKTGKIISNSNSLTEGLDNEIIKIYPNPVDNGRINIEIYMEEDQEVNLRIMDISSRLMLNKTFGVEGKKVYKRNIDLSWLSQGTYLVQVKGKNVSIFNKLVIR
ncbi:MAG: T9SS type A sorting domain-containing protein, partial [Bacteroidales bacterium]|nr:T9SS type A sorting domain-containing protein [Bacteroidales bacterium]